MNINDSDNAKRGMTTFEMVVSQLEAAVSQTRFDSGQYREILLKMDNSPLESEEQGITKKSENVPMKVDPPNTLLYKLNNLIDELVRTNSRNSEIIKEFNALL